MSNRSSSHRKGAIDASDSSRTATAEVKERRILWYVLIPIGVSIALIVNRLTMATFGLPETVALAAVAAIGYLFGQRTHQLIAQALVTRRQRELDRAARVAWQLETIAASLRQELATHHSQIAGFKRRLNRFQESGDDESWDQLCAEAESILGPTMQLAQQLAHAYDEIRQQTETLETFTKGRTDPLTGVANGRALEQQLEVLLKAAERSSGGFAVAMVSLDRNSLPAESSLNRARLEALPKLATVIRNCMRDTDFVARYGAEEFVVTMPQTSLTGACVFGDRLRRLVQEQLADTVCCGIADYRSGDEAKSLLARADSAFYSAKAAGANRQFVHNGAIIREHVSKYPASAAAPAEMIDIETVAAGAARASTKPSEVRDADTLLPAERVSASKSSAELGVAAASNGHCVAHPVA